MKAYIIGISGQDGSYMTDLLLDKGYEVWGCCRKTWNCHDLLKRANVSSLTLYKQHSIIVDDISRFQPDEVYVFGGVTDLASSFERPGYTMVVNCSAICEIIEKVGFSPCTNNIRFCIANSCEIFGPNPGPQNEKTPYNPTSPYAASKLSLLIASQAYRNLGLHVSNAILHNHVSSRQTRGIVAKLLDHVKRHPSGVTLKIGNANIERDWGYAKEFVKAMWMMSQAKVSDDYVVATGQSLSIKELCNMAFATIGVTLAWGDRGAYDSKSGVLLVETNSFLSRVAEIPSRVGDITKIKEKIGWTPNATLDQLFAVLTGQHASVD